MELCLREIILGFEMNLQNLLFSRQLNSYSYFKANTEVLNRWAVKTLGDLQSTSRGLDPGVKM
jgi:hypothetical protein